MRSTLSLLLSLSLSLTSFYLSPTPRLLSLSLSLSLFCILHYSSFHPFPCLLIHPFSSLFLDPLLHLSILLSLCIPTIPSIFLCPLWSLPRAYTRVGLFFRLPPYERQTSLPSMFSGY